MPLKLIALKVTPTEAQAVEQLVAGGYYPSASALLREGLMLVLEQHKLKFEAKLSIRQERLEHRMRKRKRKPGQDTPPEE